MRILIVTTSFPSRRPGEFLGKFVLNEARAYAENGAEVSVLTPHYPGVPVRDQFQAHLVVHRYLRVVGNRKVVWQPGLIYRVSPRRAGCASLSYLSYCGVDDLA